MANNQRMSISEIDVFWILICACLVWIMQAGFLCLETGLTRSKNNINVALKNIVDNSTSIFIFWLLGFSIAYGTPFGAPLDESSNYYLFSSSENNVNAFFVFQAVFCSTCCTIVSGAAAERLRFIMYPVAVLLIGGLIYPVAVHSAWSGGIFGNEPGWLQSLGFYDFAGSSVVHSTGGWVALALIIIVGPRLGRFDAEGRPITIQGSNLTLSALGVLVLWFGWLGFNGGSTYSFNSDIGIILSNTLIGGATSLVATLAICHYRKGSPAPEDLFNGALGGLVSITASANVISSQDAALIGLINAPIVLFASRLLLRLRMDDVVGAVPVHLAAGIWGTLAVGLFGNLDLIGSGYNRWQQTGVQALGAAFIAAWAFGISYSVLSLVNRRLALRVSREDELIGLNISEHHAASELYELIAYMKDQSESEAIRANAPTNLFSEVGVIGMAYNEVMDRLREHQQHLTRTNLELRAANEGLKTYDRAVAHDLKNPIAVIRSYIAMMQEQTDPEHDSARSLQRIRKSADDAMQIIQELLSFAGSHGETAATERVDLDVLLDACEDLLEEALCATDGRVERLLEVNGLLGSKFVLQQVLSNLIHNSLKYRHPDRVPLVRVKAWATSTAIHIAVQDNGIGIAQVELPGIFELYRRINQGDTEGHGIGLYNVRRLVERSGGRISVTSEPGQGTCFTLSFESTG